MRCITAKSVLPVALLALGLWLPSVKARAVTVDFEDLTLAADSQWDGEDTTYDNGSGDSNPFESRGATFNNFHEFSYNSYFNYDVHYWDGWAYSNRSDKALTGMAGQYTAMGSGSSGQNGAEDSANYGVAYFGFYGQVPTVSFDQPSLVDAAYFTNNAYAYHSMETGDGFAKKFGGASGGDEDWFLLTITGKDAGGATVGTEEFYLADYQFADNGLDYIIDDWTPVNLSGLGEVSSLEFGLTSSDVGSYGMNTPAYFAIDNLVWAPAGGDAAVPEPSTFVLALIATLLFICRFRLCRGR